METLTNIINDLESVIELTNDDNILYYLEDISERLCRFRGYDNINEEEDEQI